MDILPHYRKKTEIRQRRAVAFLLLFVCIIGFSEKGYSQDVKYNRFWSEIAFTRTIKNKWASEFNIEGTNSSTNGNSNPFALTTEFVVRGWLHYYYNSRWKLSFFVAYHDNLEVIEIEQPPTIEWRFGPQGIFYINKIGYTLSTRMRLEIRYIKDINNDFKNGLRYRQQLKYLQPINGKIIREGVFYGIAFDEVAFKLKSSQYENFSFDRNRFSVGGGYAINDNLQIEVSYVNEFLPRSDNNEVYNGISMNLVFNNLFKNIVKKTTSPKTIQKSE